MLKCAERAIPWLDAMATRRAGGVAAYARTIARCGRAGRTAYSMLGQLRRVGGIGLHAGKALTMPQIVGSPQLSHTIKAKDRNLMLCICVWICQSHKRSALDLSNFSEMPKLLVAGTL